MIQTGSENIDYTIVKYEVMLHGRHKALTPTVVNINEPGPDKTYNKTGVTSIACTTTQYGKGARLSLFG